MPQIFNSPPQPSSTIQSIRHWGYSLDTAIADIIDNSISAASNNMQIHSRWNNGDPFIAIEDNGYGMSLEELQDNMVFGCKHLEDIRGVNDLGRFGLGMKTASISQCLRLTVVSKKNKEIAICQWDLEYIASNQDKGWSLKVYSDDDLDGLSDHEKSYVLKIREYSDSGTIVIWSSLDLNRPGQVGANSEEKFDEAISKAMDHQEWVFYKFLSNCDHLGKVEISHNGRNLIGRDPFLTQETVVGEEEFQGVFFRAYILRHKSSFAPNEKLQYEDNVGPKGNYLDSQGFYVYRQRRLISHSSWFRMKAKENRSQLVRFEICVPNSQDADWKLTVKKSELQPPPGIRKRLQDLIIKVCKQSESVIQRRAFETIDVSDVVPLWKRIADGTMINYIINQSHPIFKDVDPALKSQLNTILRKVAQEFPIEGLVLDKEMAQRNPEKEVKMSFEEITKFVD